MSWYVPATRLRACMVHSMIVGYASAKEYIPLHSACTTIRLRLGHSSKLDGARLARQFGTSLLRRSVLFGCASAIQVNLMALGLHEKSWSIPSQTFRTVLPVAADRPPWPNCPREYLRRRCNCPAAPYVLSRR